MLRPFLTAALAVGLASCAQTDAPPAARVQSQAKAQPAVQAAAAAPVASAPAAAYVPTVGQAGKDVVWVPTPDALVERMLNMAKVTSRDFVVDLGSGDGRTVVMAAKKFGADALGIEFNPDLVVLSQQRAEREGVAGKAKFVRGDIFEYDFTRATVVTMYLLPDINLKLRPKLLEMKPGTRLVSHAFTMGDWEPDEKAEVENRTAMLWIVPAKVAGNWTLKGTGGSLTVTLQQSFQKLDGSVRRGNATAKVEEGRVNGENVSFSFSEGGRKQRFTGRLQGDQLVGSLDGSSVSGTRSR